MSMYTAMQVAEYIINKCTQEKHPISNLQLQKILYYIQVESLRINGNPIFYDAIEAWQFGPVVPNVYYNYCGFGSLPIDLTYNIAIINEADKPIINKIVEEKRSMSPWILVNDTHNPAKSWSRIYNSFGSHAEIPVSLIRELDL